MPAFQRWAFLPFALVSVACSSSSNSPSDAGTDAGATDPVKTSAGTVIDEGRQTFRFETFGDEAFWGDTLKLHQAIEGSAHGGVGPGLSPATALSVGLKVDSDVLPASLINSIKAGQVNLNDPAVTLQLLDASAVVGVKGFSNGAGGLQKVGISCALCHSTVDDSVAPGIGKRLDGWPNRDLNVGAIVNLSPDLSAVDALLGVDDATVRKVLMSWGPGKFDAELFLDGKAFQPDGKTSAATLLPPAFGLRGVNLHTWTGWGSITQWNAFVANLEMHGVGHYTDERLDDANKFPVAARAHMGHTVPPAGATDQITDKLGALEFYQLALDAPTPPAGSFDAAAAARGKTVFEGAAKCATCHVPPLYTDAGWNMHSNTEIGIDDFQASRAPDGKYRTSPLRGLFAHSKGGFYHDGRFATLADVVSHYDSALSLGLSSAQQSDLVEYLKSL
jgi:mono/diheme cytochrome c family protein